MSEEPSGRAKDTTANRAAPKPNLFCPKNGLDNGVHLRHHVDFRDPSTFDLGLDKLVWPGITNKKVAFFAMSSLGSVPWPALERIVRGRGFDFYSSDYVETSKQDIEDLNDSDLLVVVVDPFEDWPWSSYGGREPSTYWNAISEIRPNRSVVFLLYQHPGALQRVDSGLTAESIKQLARFFTLPKLCVDSGSMSDAEYSALRASFEENWLRVQREFCQRVRHGAA